MEDVWIDSEVLCVFLRIQESLRTATSKLEEFLFEWNFLGSERGKVVSEEIALFLMKQKWISSLYCFQSVVSSSATGCSLCSERLFMFLFIQRFCLWLWVPSPASLFVAVVRTEEPRTSVLNECRCMVLMKQWWFWNLPHGSIGDWKDLKVSQTNLSSFFTFAKEHKTMFL